MEKVLPYSIEAEEGVLGSLFIDSEAIYQVVTIVRPEDFYRNAHQAIYAVIYDLFQKHRGPADLITVCDELQRRGQLEEMGGSAYVAGLVNAVPTAAHVQYYAHIVEREAIKRRLIQVAGQVASLAMNEEDPHEAVSKAHKLLMDVNAKQLGSLEDDFADVLDALQEEVTRRIVDGADKHLLKTGLSALTTAIGGGMDRGELIYVAGRPGSGKSVVGLDTARAAAEQVREQGGTVFYYTLEMTSAQQAQRMIASETEINTQLIRTGFRKADGTRDNVALEAFNAKVADLKRRLGGVLKMHSTPISVDNLHSRLYQAVASQNCRLAVIDQLDLFEDERRDKEHDMISYTSKRLKQIANDLRIPILALVQLNREVEHRTSLAGKRPTLPDFRYSGRLEMDADQVWFVFRPSLYEQRPQVPHWNEYGEVILGKMRDGQRGLMIPFRFKEQYTAISDWPHEYGRPIIE